MPSKYKIIPTMTNVKSTTGKSEKLPPPPQCGITRGINITGFIVVFVLVVTNQLQLYITKPLKKFSGLDP